jgi:glycosyltransferase involved in cell wall biosynthesis
MVPSEQLGAGPRSKPRILLGVTSDASLALMKGLPEYLGANGWEVHVVSAPGPGLAELERAGEVTSHGIAMLRDPSPWRDLRSLLRWVQLVKRLRPDVISVGTPKAGLLGGLAGWFARVPHRVYLLRGLRLETTSGVKRVILTALERVSFASAHTSIAVSASLMQKVVEMKLVSPHKITVLGHGSSNGIDAGDISCRRLDIPSVNRMREELGLSRSVPVIGFVGRLNPDKGLDVLAEARRILVSRNVDHQFLLVGGVDHGVRGKGADLLMSSGRAPVLTGQVVDPAPYYQMMDVFCLPSLREGFPNVVLEAGASRLPTVTTNATGAVDSVVEGSTGLVAPVNDAESLADHLEVLLRDEKLRASMGRLAFEHVTAHFDRTDVWRATEEYYRTLLASNRKGVNHR